MDSLFIQRLIHLCKEKKLKPQQLRYHINVQSATITKWTKGELLPNPSVLIKLSQYFNCSTDYLLGLSDVKEIITSENLKKNIPPEDKHILDQYHHLNHNNKSIVDYIFEMEEKEVDLPNNTIHLLDMGELISIDTYTEKVSAGDGNTTVTGRKVSKLYPTTKISSKATYAARITGNSMEPRFIDNDIIYVNDNKIPEHDDIGVFTYNGETYCKKYYAKDGVEKLISLNDLYKPIIIDRTLQFEKQGVVIGKFHAD